MANPNGMGTTNAALPHGRIAYGTDGTNFYPIKVDSNGGLGITKTIQTEMIAAQTIAASTFLASTTLSLTGTKRATFLIQHGRAATAAFGTNGTEYRIEVSAQSSGNDTWLPIASVLASSAVCMSAAASASGTSAAIGATLVTILSGTAAVVGDIICWTSGTIEFCRVVAISGTASFTVQDGLTYAHTAATGMFGGAEFFPISLDVEGVTRCRAVVNNVASGTTNAIVSRIACITEQ